MAVSEKNGLLTYKDGAGNKYLLYPITKLDCVDGAENLAAAVTTTGSGNAVTAVSKSGDTITVTKGSTFLTSETQLSKGTDATATKTLSHGGTFTAVTDTAVSGHKITDTTTTFTLPSETALSKGTDATASKTLTHGGTFTAVTDTAVSGHKITDTTTTYTLPSETALSISSSGSGNAITGLSVSGHQITITKGATFSASNHTHNAATTSAAGMMSAEDKVKLNGIAEGANAYIHPSYTARTGVPTANATPAFGGTFSVSQPVSDASGHITAINSRTVKIPNTAATASAAGLMSASDKSKLDGITTITNAEIDAIMADIV